MPCTALAAILVVCMEYVPDRSKTVSVPLKCIRQLQKIGQYDNAKQCAADEGVRWKIDWRRRHR